MVRYIRERYESSNAEEHGINVTFGANYEEENVATLVPPVFWNVKTTKIPFLNWIDFNYVYGRRKNTTIDFWQANGVCHRRFLTSISLSIEGVLSSDINTFFFCFELWILILPAVLGWRKVSIENRLRQKLKLLLKLDLQLLYDLCSRMFWGLNTKIYKDACMYSKTIRWYDDIF